MIKSIYGKGDKLTAKVLKGLRLEGSWLDLATGDGRYISDLLNSVDSLLATDIDKKALFKLLSSVPKEKRYKIRIKVTDITKKFPFKDESFDGIFCTGTLHLFPREVLNKIFHEIDRILKPKGKVIIDFAVDVKRRFHNRKLKIFKNEPKYNLKSTKQFLKDYFKDYKIKMYESNFTDDLTKVKGYGYLTTGKFILLIAVKL